MYLKHTAFDGSITDLLFIDKYALHYKLKTLFMLKLCDDSEILYEMQFLFWVIRKQKCCLFVSQSWSGQKNHHAVLFMNTYFLM